MDSAHSREHTVADSVNRRVPYSACNFLITLATISFPTMYLFHGDNKGIAYGLKLGPF